MTMQGGRVQGNQLGECHHTTWPEKRTNERGGGSEEVGSWFEETDGGDETK